MPLERCVGENGREYCFLSSEVQQVDHEALAQDPRYLVISPADASAAQAQPASQLHGCDAGSRKREPGTEDL